MVILNALGGRADHTEHNMRLLARYFRRDRALVIKSMSENIIFLRDQNLQLSGQPGARVSLFACPQAIISSRGLRYEMTNHALRMSDVDSISNSMGQDTATIQVDGEVLCVLAEALLWVCG